MEELAQSIVERGVIVPIKVRPNGVGYEVVYGHRRVEAARRVGLSEIPVIVDELNDIDAIIHALIENIQREDMEPMDLAHALLNLQSLTGWNLSEMARRNIMKRQTLSVTLALLNEDPSVQTLVKGGAAGGHQSPTGSISREHVSVTRAAGLTVDERVPILHKAAKEGLGFRATRAFAEAYIDAGTPELKQKVLETSGKQRNKDHILVAARMKLGGDALTEDRHDRQRRAFEDYDESVKDFLDAAKLFDSMIIMARNAVKYDKFSPEGAQFASRRIAQLIDELSSLQEDLANVR